MIHNFLDIIVLALLALFVLTGVYRGFLNSLLSLGAFLVSCALAALFMPLLSNGIKTHEEFYNTVLYYTEGAEFVEDVEISRSTIYAVDTATLERVTANPDMPYPMGDRVYEAIQDEAFAEEGFSTVGDYFNLTIVNTSINILSFLMLYVLIRLILGFLLNNADYAIKGFPQLHRFDRVIGGGLGLIRGFLGLFVLFLLIPLVLIVLPVDLVRDLVEESAFLQFYYHSNILLQLIP